MSRLFEASQRAVTDTEADPGVSATAPIAGAGDATQVFPLERRLRPSPTESSALARVPTHAGVALPAPPPVGAQKEIAIASDGPGALKLVTAGLEQASFNEYRQLAATLLQTNADKPVLVVAVTSALPGEGKTLTSANLALILADAYRRRVLLVDGDMRRPTLHTLFGAANSLGLGDCLKAAHLVPGSTVEIGRGLTLLPAGRPDRDPVGQLSSPRFKEFLDHASKTFDCIVFDTPPAVLLPDAELIASAVHTVLLVVQAAKTPYQDVQRAVAALGRERIAGVVLNRVAQDTRRASGYHQYYAGFHDASEP
uniref:CobQ/CobB/MinD/ParA nucleotide binding domain-containing protein n=1 Tax=uncultured bacterium lac193 TaxID=1447243 RepID=X2LJV2_9BACT|nr:hypothetical protein [uncultured bacterium lac193]